MQLKDLVTQAIEDFKLNQEEAAIFTKIAFLIDDPTPEGDAVYWQLINDHDDEGTPINLALNWLFDHEWGYDSGESARDILEGL